MPWDRGVWERKTSEGIPFRDPSYNNYSYVGIPGSIKSKNSIKI